MKNLLSAGYAQPLETAHLAWTFTDFDIHSISMMQTRVIVLFDSISKKKRRNLSLIVSAPAQVCIGHHEPVSQYSETLTETAGDSSQLVVEMNGLPM